MPAVIEPAIAPISTSTGRPSSSSSASASSPTAAARTKLMAFQNNDFEEGERSDCEAEVHELLANNDVLVFSNASGTSAATTWNENDAGSSCGVTLNGGEQLGADQSPQLLLKERREEEEAVEVENTVPLLPALTPPNTSKKMKMNFIKVLSTTEDEEELFNSWKVITKTKGVLSNGTRLENASWRRWFQKKYNIPQVPVPPKNLAPGSSDLDDSDTDSMESTDMADPASSPSNFQGILKSGTLKRDGLASDLLDGSHTTVNESLELSPSSNGDVHHSPTKKQRKQQSCLKAEGKRCPMTKSVSFNEDLNQVAFVNYQEENNWDDSEKEMLINVDELSRIRHSSSNLNPPNRSADLGSLMALKGACPSSPSGDPLSPGLSTRPLDLHATAEIDFPPIPVIPHFLFPQKAVLTKRASDNELMGEERKLTNFHGLEDDDDTGQELDAFSIIEFFIELFVFLRWCAGMCFINPGSFGI